MSVAFKKEKADRNTTKSDANKGFDMHGCSFGHVFGWGGWQIEIGCAILVAVLVLYVGRRLLRWKKYGSDRRDSLEILKQRLASGEISLEEYEKIRKVL